MPRFDFEPDVLRSYRPDVAEPADFDTFWARTLEESRGQIRPPTLSRVESPLRLVEVYDLAYSGFGGDRVHAWMLVPTGTAGPLPAVVEFLGYGGGRGRPHEHLNWATAGYVHIIMDTRGQGSAGGTGGATPDPHGSEPAFPGFMTRGITGPDDYYYRRVFTDGVLLIDAVREVAAVDPDRVAVTGVSQGGGITIAVAGLVDGLVGAMPEVPFLCHFERAVGLTDKMPYGEIVKYLSVHPDRVEQAFTTLSYFDGVNFTRRATAPALFSVGLIDPVCPPSTVYAARNHWGAGAVTADIVEYAFNEHEAGQGHQWERQAAWLAERLSE